MGYRSIGTILHDPSASTVALDFAIAMARDWNAHLHIICAGVDITDPGFYYAGAQTIAVQRNLEHARDTAQELEALVREKLKPETLTWDVETVTMMNHGLAPFVVNQMRYADMVVLPLPYSGSGGQIDTIGFEACLFDADIPVMVVPDGVTWAGQPDRVMVAWNDGAEALAAARAALPMAVKASTTDIYVVEPPLHGQDRSDPGGRLAQVYARAGAHVEITVAARQASDIASQLLQRARETGADLLVMGGYGHSRLREAVLGGVTRSMLHDATLPVLMAR